MRLAVFFLCVFFYNQTAQTYSQAVAAEASRSSLVGLSFFHCPRTPFNTISLLIPISVSHSDLSSPTAVFVHRPDILLSLLFLSVTNANAL